MKTTIFLRIFLVTSTTHIKRLKLLAWCCPKCWKKQQSCYHHKNYAHFKSQFKILMTMWITNWLHSHMNWSWTLCEGTREMAGSGTWFWPQWLLSGCLERFWTSYLSVLCKNVFITYIQREMTECICSAAVPHRF